LKLTFVIATLPINRVLIAILLHPVAALTAHYGLCYFAQGCVKAK